MADRDTQARKVRALVNAFVALYPNSEWGPAHIVLSDYNLRDGSLRAAMQWAVEETPKTMYTPEYDYEMLAATKQFLKLLATLPKEWRDE